MYYKKGIKKDIIRYNSKENYIIDSKGRKRFWLRTRVSKTLFNILRLKFDLKYRKWGLLKKKFEFCFLISDLFLNFKDFFFFLFVKKSRKNIFANYSDISGNVIYKASSGFFHKRSFRKTFFATSFLLKNMENSIVVKKLFLDKKKEERKRSFFFLNIVGNNYQRGFRKNLKDFLKKESDSKFHKITELKCKAHNGVRKAKKRRK